MKKVLSIVLGVVTVAIVGLVGVVSMQPDELKVERSVTVAATPADVFPFANDYAQWQKWNPWRELDPSQKETFSDNKAGVGAWYAWEGNDQVGKGRMDIRESVQDQKVVEDLHFMEPFESRAVVTLTMVPVGAETKVTWGFVSQSNFVAKAFGLFTDMDAMLGADFQRGLDKLAPLAAAAAIERVEAAERAVAEAAAVPADGVVPVDGVVIGGVAVEGAVPVAQ
ncbi:MAG: SRPBCC family protein [Pseudomonadota bacterium]|nr:SRPBCC family protein [Pseudomonadota bacterium]